MRLHKLVLRAFGPFPGTEVVDFDALADAGLFLLHGETGAGKTSVLDAVGFALYGVLPSARGTSRLRSDHAAADAVPEVSLEVTVRGRRLVVTRTPAHTRPKRRGEGTTDVPPSARLEEVTPEGHTTLATRAQEVGHELGALLPLTAEQFFQVVLLPQGEFARFLRADATARAGLLSTLFRIERFGAVESWFSARRASAREAVERARGRRDIVVARVAQAAGLGREDLPEAGDSAWLEGLREAADRRRDEAARRVEQCAEAAGQRAAERVEAADLARRQERRRGALARAQALAARAAEVAATEERLRVAERAAPVLPLVAAAQRAVAEGEALAASARAALARLPREAVPSAAGDEPQVAALRASAAATREEVGALRALLPLADRVGSDTARAASARRRAAEADGNADRVRASLAALPQERERRERELAAARAAVAALDGLRAAAAAATVVAEAASALPEARRALTLAEDGEREARGAWLSARERHDDLRERRIDGMRAELASALDPGTPCPVCGSLEHPDLAELPPEHVDRATEREAAAEVRRQSDRLERALRRLHSAERVVEGLLGRLAPAAGGDTADAGASPLPDPATATAEADLLGRRVAAAERCAGGLAQAEAARAAVEEEADELRGRLAEAEREAAAARAEADAAESAAAEGAALLEAARGRDASLDARTARLTAEAGLADTAAEALTAAAEGRRRAAAATEAAERAAAEAGFAGPAAVLAARLEEDAARALRAAVLQHRQQTAEVEGLLSDPDLAVPTEPPADLDDADRRLAEAEAALAAARAEAVEAGRRAADLAELAADLDEAERELGPAVAAGEQVRVLADLVGGLTGNELRMTLSSFVLAARLEEVAAAASVRLERMTSGRYTLVHSDSLASRGRRSGLGLRVRDAWTGVERDTATLSGGETFLASLALALGLAEVVTAEAGGARLDTLFVDEGFGTLDPEALDQVLEVLDGLRDGGRTVGVVSHVAELRQRIPVGLRVSRGRAGSSLALVAGD